MNLNLLDFIFYIIISLLIFSIIDDIIKQISLNRSLKKIQNFGEFERALLISFILGKKSNVEIETKKEDKDDIPEQKDINTIGDYSSTSTRTKK